MNRFFAATAAAAMLLSMTACSSAAPASSSQAAPVTGVEDGVLTIAMECAYAPFNWSQTTDANGAVKIANGDLYANGYDVQIAKYIAQELGINCVTVSCQILEKAHSTSFVLMDHGNATLDCIGYLKSCGRCNIALFGIIENSFADKTKATFFDKNDIYPLGKDGIEACFETLFSNISKYNAVICSNYITAIYLISSLKERGIAVPKDIYAVAYGDSQLGRTYSPSITAITLNHAALGVQAVEVYRYISKQEENISITARIPCRIILQAQRNMPRTTM